MDRTRSGLRRVFALLLLLGLLFSPLRVCGEGPEYIVKYKADALEAGDPRAALPFDLVDEAELRRLERAGLLDWWEPDGRALLLDPVTGDYEEEQWNLDMIGAGEVFRRGCLGDGVRVGVLDSGVSPHPDFGDRLLPGHNYISDAADPTDTADSYGHGTRVAGVIAAAGDQGCIGVAPGASIVPLKVTDGLTVKISTLCDAIYGAIDDYGCTVLNLSMGVPTDYSSLREAVAYAESQNVVVVSAVGNDGNGTLYYPAAYDTVIGVGAVNRDGGLYFRSNYSAGVFLTAPGVALRSTAAAGGYASSTGTSFSTPHTAGAAAVLQNLVPDLSPAEIRAILAETAEDAGDPGYDERYGYGILNLSACVATLLSDPDPCAFLPAHGPARMARNNTDGDLECEYFVARYGDGGECLELRVQRLSIPAGTAVALTPPEGAGSCVQFLCAADSLIPLTAARRSG